MNKKDERFQIILPFLQGKKTLKEIEKESNISYATLKRWIKNYRENGINGLEIKSRADKNSFRKADETTIKKIKKLYSSNKEKSLIELYKKVKETLEENMSFNTFYRVINQLDTYLKNKSKFQINRNIKNGDIYIVKSFISYHFIKYKEFSKLPIILLVFNASTSDFIDFHICFSDKYDNSLLAFFRKFILKGAYLFECKELPKEILIDLNFSIPKKIKENVLKESKIKILEFETNNDDINNFIINLKNDLNKNFFEETSYDEFIKFIKNYCVFYNQNSKLLLEKEKIQLLNCFLTTTKRKIHSYGIQVNNSFYNLQLLSKHTGKIIKILFDPLEQSFIFAKIEKEYIKIPKIK